MNGSKKLAVIGLCFVLLLTMLWYVNYIAEGKPEGSSLNQILSTNEEHTHGDTESGTSRIYYSYTKSGLNCYGMVVQSYCEWDNITNDFDSLLIVYLGQGSCVWSPAKPKWPDNWNSYNEVYLTTRYGSGGRISGGDDYAPKLVLNSFCRTQALANGLTSKMNAFAYFIPYLGLGNPYP